MSKTHEPDTVLKELIEGNQRFLSGQSTQCSIASLKKLKDFAENGQFPKAVILCCSDSRAPVEMIFDQDLGDLFVIRVAGNVLAPSLVGSVEFAVSTFGTRLVMVMGHTQCGAIKATLDSIEDSSTVPSANIHDIVSRIKPHIFSIAQTKDLSQEDKIQSAVEANVHASVDHLSHSSRLIEQWVNDGNIKIVGSVLNLATGQVDMLEA